MEEWEATKFSIVTSLCETLKAQFTLIDKDFHWLS